MALPGHPDPSDHAGMASVSMGFLLLMFYWADLRWTLGKEEDALGILNHLPRWNQWWQKLFGWGQ